MGCPLYQISVQCIIEKGYKEGKTGNTGLFVERDTCESGTIPDENGGFTEPHP